MSHLRFLLIVILITYAVPPTALLAQEKRRRAGDDAIARMDARIKAKFEKGTRPMCRAFLYLLNDYEREVEEAERVVRAARRTGDALLVLAAQGNVSKVHKKAKKAQQLISSWRKGRTTRKRIAEWGASKDDWSVLYLGCSDSGLTERPHFVFAVIYAGKKSPGATKLSWVAHDSHGDEMLSYEAIFDASDVPHARQRKVRLKVAIVAVKKIIKSERVTKSMRRMGGLKVSIDAVR